MACIRLRLLRAFALDCDGQRVPLPATAQRVLVFVALHDRPVQRSYVAGSLWLDSPDERAHASLRSALWRLRRCDHSLVETSGGQLALSRDIDVDLRESQVLAMRALDVSDRDALDIDAAVFENDLLPDWYDDWVLIERERHRQLRLHALDALCERLTRSGRLDEALVLGLTAVAGEPLRESAHRAVVRIHLAEGNASEAIRQYRLCRRLLSEQLGVEPSEQMLELVRGMNAKATAR